MIGNSNGTQSFTAHVKEGFIALDVFKKIWWVFVGLIVVGSSLRGAWTFVQEGPELLVSHESRIDDLEDFSQDIVENLNVQFDGIAMERTAAIARLEIAHTTDVAKIDSRLEYLVCTAQQKSRTEQGLLKDRDCESIIF